MNIISRDCTNNPNHAVWFHVGALPAKQDSTIHGAGFDVSNRHETPHKWTVCRHGQIINRFSTCEAALQFAIEKAKELGR